MDRPCDHCGTEYTPKRSTSKYCTPTCRKAANREAKKPKPTDDSTGDELGLVETTQRELERAGALSTVEGQAALVLAGRIVRNASDSGSSVAALTRELRTAVTLATKGKTTGDRIDELREKRRQRERRRASG